MFEIHMYVYKLSFCDEQSGLLTGKKALLNSLCIDFAMGLLGRLVWRCENRKHVPVHEFFCYPDWTSGFSKHFLYDFDIYEALKLPVKICEGFQVYESSNYKNRLPGMWSCVELCSLLFSGEPYKDWSACCHQGDECD